MVVESHSRAKNISIFRRPKNPSHAALSGEHPLRDIERTSFALAIRPEDVASIFITHAHFDHIGKIEDFPNATFYIQERELTTWIWAMSLPDRLRYMMVATDPSDVLRAADLARQGRLRLVDGDVRDVIPGIDLHAAADNYTYGFQWVSVRNDLQTPANNSSALAGDLVYVYENLEGSGADKMYSLYSLYSLYSPVGLALGSITNLVMTSHEIMKSVGYEVKRVIPVHEERLKDVFPSRIKPSGLCTSEICLASGQKSLVF